MSTEKAVLAGGCFWGVEELIRHYPSVISAIVGYTGGDVPMQLTVTMVRMQKELK